jgi:serine/threonine protein phosphatase PrpC
MPADKNYIKKLVETYGREIKKGELDLFDKFCSSELVNSSYSNIQKEVQIIMAHWNKDTRVNDIKQEQVNLSNGMVKRAYHQVFSINAAVMQHIEAFDLIIPDQLGLVYDSPSNTISGTPVMAGEHKLTLRYKLKDDPSGTDQWYEKELLLIINPDPKSLWKNEPSNEKDEYWKQDDISELFNMGAKTLIVGSRRGRSHAHEAKFRDDDFDYWFDEDTGWSAVTVADGAGSAIYSRGGSKRACDAVANYFHAQTKEQWETLETFIRDYQADKAPEKASALSNAIIGVLGNAVKEAYDNIVNEAGRKQAAVKDYSTTLIFSLYKKFDFGYFVSAFWVGDGGVGIYTREPNSVKVLGEADSGEYAGQTRFLTMLPELVKDQAAFAKRYSMTFVEDFTALVLMTDGITDPKFQTDANLARLEKWNEFWDDLAGNNADKAAVHFSRDNQNLKEEILTWLDFWSPGNHDDRTLAIVF